MTYTYSSGDLLVEKPVYNFAAFQGLPFLEAYRQSRRDWLSTVSVHALTEEGARDSRALLESARASSPDVARVPVPSAEHGPILLRDYLRGMISRIFRDPGSIRERRFPTLVQRFEVTKRLWTSVDFEFRPAEDAASDCVEVYALFSLCCLLAYEASSHLSFLNAALKANDILGSQQAERLSAAESFLVGQAVEMELRLIGRLATISGIDWK